MDPSPQPTDPVQVIGQQPQTPSKPGGKKMLYLVLFVLVMASAGASAYFLLKPAPLSPPLQLSSSPSPSLTLDLMSPTNDEIAVNNEILVSGTTLPNTTVVIFTETDESSIESDATGKFETTIVVQPGINTLTVTAFSETGDEKSVTRDIVFDTE